MSRDRKISSILVGLRNAADEVRRFVDVDIDAERTGSMSYEFVFDFPILASVDRAGHPRTRRCQVVLQKLVSRLRKEVGDFNPKATVSLSGRPVVVSHTDHRAPRFKEFEGTEWRYEVKFHERQDGEH